MASSTSCLGGVFAESSPSLRGVFGSGVPESLEDDIPDLTPPPKKVEPASCVGASPFGGLKKTPEKEAAFPRQKSAPAAAKRPEPAPKQKPPLAPAPKPAAKPNNKSRAGRVRVVE